MAVEGILEHLVQTMFFCDFQQPFCFYAVSCMQDSSHFTSPAQVVRNSFLLTPCKYYLLQIDVFIDQCPHNNWVVKSNARKPLGDQSLKGCRHPIDTYICYLLYILYVIVFLFQLGWLWQPGLSHKLPLNKTRCDWLPGYMSVRHPLGQ